MLIYLVVNGELHQGYSVVKTFLDLGKAQRFATQLAEKRLDPGFKSVPNAYTIKRFEDDNWFVDLFSQEV